MKLSHFIFENKMFIFGYVLAVTYSIVYGTEEDVFDVMEIFQIKSCFFLNKF